MSAEAEAAKLRAKQAPRQSANGHQSYTVYEPDPGEADAARRQREAAMVRAIAFKRAQVHQNQR